MVQDPKLLGGPIFCGGDVLWQTEAGETFPLKQFEDYTQSPHKGAFIVGDEVIDLSKTGATAKPRD